MNLWLILIAGGLITYATRLSFIFLLGRLKMPDWLKRSLRFVPPAVLSAIIVPELIFHAGKIDASLHNFRLIAGLLAILVAFRTRNTLLTIVLGMAALLILQSLFGTR
jgi:branched-subunit amino acid transport protein